MQFLIDKHMYNRYLKVSFLFIWKKICHKKYTKFVCFIVLIVLIVKPERQRITLLQYHRLHQESLWQFLKQYFYGLLRHNTCLLSRKAKNGYKRLSIT